ncbi:TonB-dependent receptor domain-containing protein [Pseudorhodoferax sp. Leaf274]|uniref:TonB-dependent receptor domain-containing protein n=1 Tax=Pseudorhodoferax sp. Leaf274 TaxID=1736318 RepID=UPI0007023F0D|nr:TonB-dependent receptor [Pseudorhodoferax sp. Leaf274]KQP44570.1 TonB-dependent receptor [Pseudorhodoferax sp. Leaf274]
MKIPTSHVRLAALPLALSVCWPLAASAQGAPALQDTVVTATRSAQPLADLVGDVSILDRTAIERSGATGVADVLARLPGVQIARNGGQGTNTSVFVRGAESRYTAVYLDGVRLDSQSTGGVQWEQIPLSQIDRIEVLRGPAAAVYGSDAVGGVIQLFTRKGEAGKPAPYVGVGAGSHRTWQLEAGISGRTGTDSAIDYSLGVSKERSDGFNVQPQNLRRATDGVRNPDDDGYARLSGNARVGLQINKAHRLDATLLASQLESQYDNFMTSASAPRVDDRNHNRLRTAGLTWAGQWTEAYSTRVQVTDSHSRYATTPSYYRAETDLRGYLWQNEYRIGAHLLSATLERREDALVNGGIDRDRSQNALALGYGLNSGPHALQLNLRRDDDSEFGGHTNGSAAYGYAITPAWRATVSAGTSFRAPTLYQRFSEYGVGSLEPEEGRNLEAGLRWTQGATSAGVVVYRNRVRNMIVFGGAGACASTFGCYENVGRAQYEGVTLSASHAVGNVQLRGSVDFQDPKDRITDRQLARRAKRYASFGADTQVAGWTLGAELQATGQRYDNAANTNVLGGYTLVNLYTSTQIARDFTLTARVDNLTDKQYETARLYANAGRALWVGLKWAPN